MDNPFQSELDRRAAPDDAGGDAAASPANPFAKELASRSAPASTPATADKPGLLARVKDAFTGELRTEFPDAPEFLQAHTRATNGDLGAFNAISRSAITSDPAAALDILRKNIPGLESKTDKHGNLMLKAPGMSEWSYLNKPGLSARDLDELGTQTLATLPFLGSAGAGNTVAGRIASGAGFMGAAGLEKEALAKAAGSEQAPESHAGDVILGGLTAPGVPSAIVDAGANAMKAASAPFRNAARGAFNPEGEAARRVAQSYRETVAGRGANAMTPEQLQNTAANALQERTMAPGSDASFGGDTRLMDIMGERGRGLARSAANTSPEARDTLNAVIQPRFEGQAGRASEFVQDLVGGNLAGRSRDALEEMAYTARAPFYERAFTEGAGGIMTPELQRLAQAPRVRDAMARAGDELLNKNAAGRLQTTAHGPQGPTLEYWDQVKRLLNSDYNRLAGRGQTTEAGNVAGITDRLVAALDRAIPSYREARGVSMGIFRANNALDAGENYVTARVGREEAERAIAELNPQERELFRQGFISRYLDQISRQGDRRNLAGRLANSTAERDRLETALGPRSARELEAFLHHESLMDLSRSAVSGNSTTARQLMELGLAGGVGSLVSGFDPSNPAGWIAGILTKYGAHRANAAVDTRVAQHIAEMLTSRDPTVMRRGLQAAGASTPILDALRRADAALSGIGRETAVSAAAEQTRANPLPANAMASGKGLTATNPKTGERLILNGGAWRPLPK